MNLKHLEHLLAVAETGSFSRAAEQQHREKPGARLLADLMEAFAVIAIKLRNSIIVGNK